MAYLAIPVPGPYVPGAYCRLATRLSTSRLACRATRAGQRLPTPREKSGSLNFWALRRVGCGSVDPRLLGGLPQAGTSQSRAQHLTDLSRRNLPERHPNPQANRPGEIRIARR
jgi:hypothetical protein